MILNSPYISGSLTISDGIFIRSYENNSINIGSNVVGSFPTSDGNGANIEYLVKSNLNYRVGNIMVVWDGSNIQFAETTTLDIGDTSGVELSLDINSGNVRILATAASTGFTVKTLTKLM